MVEELTLDEIAQNRIDRFKAWAKASGAIGLENIEFVDKERGFGLRLTKDIKHRDSIFAIPASCFISVDSISTELKELME